MFTHSRYPKTGKNNYEVSSKGDKRFSALYATLQDGRTIEEAYQLDVKGYRKFGNNWKLGKGKKPLDLSIDTWKEYKNLWKLYLDENPDLVSELQALNEVNFTDMFANSPISQARALAELLNELNPIESIPMKQFNPMQYLAIDIANHYGLDKEPYEARINWVKQNQDKLESLQNQAEEPILFAKAVKALRDTENGLPTGYTVALDSVNSGLQIMSAVMRDKRGCELTGLIDPDVRSDAYTAIMERMNDLLKQEGVDEIQVSRKEAKEACMTWAYGSKAVPERIFGDLVEYFYEAMKQEFQGVTELLGVLTASWNNWALHHKWTLPDLHMAYVPVMQTVKERYKVEQLGYQPTVIYSKNEGEEFGISNIANVIHSLDAYLLRTMVRYCNYNKGAVRNFIRKVEQAKYKEVQTNEMVHKWQDTGIADIGFINHIDDVSVYPFEMINQLYNKCCMLLQYEPFEIITIHDSFACHANHCQRMRYYYNVILAELSDSTTIDDICSQLFNEKGTVEKGNESLSDYIKQANYAIC